MNGLAVTNPKPDSRVRNVLILDNELGMGGVEKKLFDFVSRIDRARFNVAVCCLKQAGFFKAGFESLGVHVHENLLGHKYDVLAYGKLLRIIRDERIDLLYTFAHPNTVIFAAMARAMGKVDGLIVSFHAMGNATGGKLLSAYQKPFLRKADALIAVANQHKQYLVEVEGLHGAHITVVHNGVDIDKYRAGDPAVGIRAGLGIVDGEFVVTTIASLKPAKCVNNLLRAAAAINQTNANVRYVIVGGGPDRADLEAQAKQLGIADRVTFTGIREDVDEILRASDIFVLPSRLGTETFPNVVLEAMASGLPVVSTDVGSVRELVTDEVNGWVVPPENVDALTAKLADLIGDPDRARAWGRRGREIVEAEFRLERMCDKRQALFSKVLGIEGA